MGKIFFNSAYYFVYFDNRVYYNHSLNTWE